MCNLNMYNFKKWNNITIICILKQTDLDRELIT